MAYYNLEHSYNKFSGKKFRDSLSSFLPNLPGVIDTPGHSDNSSLRSIIDKPPIGGKELVTLTSVQLSGFRLHPGPVRSQLVSPTNKKIIYFITKLQLPEQYRIASMVPQKKKQKNKKHKKNNEISAREDGGQISGTVLASGVVGEGGAGSGGESYEKKHKKQKRHDSDDKDRKKKKKEKKKKKQKHSPEHPGSLSTMANSSGNPPNMMPLL